MNTEETQGRNDSEEKRISTIIADIIVGKQSVLELLEPVADGDYWAAVQSQRLFLVLTRDVEVLQILKNELETEISRCGGSDYSIPKELAFKDGKRRFNVLMQKRAKVFNGSSLLSGTNFSDCLSQYLKLLAHVEALWSSACELFRSGTLHLSAFVSILVIEEVGKLANLAQELVAFDIPRKASKAVIDRDHRRKHIIAVLSGALINARLDRVLGKNVVKKLLHEVESDGFEKTRQNCLYIDLYEGNPVTPEERVGAERAQMLVVLAGELMAEVLGHFPWEFDRMLENVITFEREIGLPEKKITRS
ncbi:MAG: AbiV family abortive infection protein [Acidobacteriaceae bacterium]